MSDGVRQRRGHSDARDVILEAAAQVFNTKGRAMTVEDIARQAGYSTSALYKHFSNKEDILRSLWRRVGQRVLEVVEDAPPVELGFIDRTRWLLYNLTQLAEDERELFVASMATAPIVEPVNQVDEEILANYQANQEAFLALMNQGIEEGVLRDEDPAVYATALGGHLREVVMQWAFIGPFPLRPHVDKMLEFFLRGAAVDTVRHELFEE